jgi:hypothetical protein
MQNAKTYLGNMYAEYFGLINENDITTIRKSVICIIYDLSNLLVEINGMPIKRIRKYQKQEILNMGLIPEDFEIIYEKLFVECNCNYKLPDLVSEYDSSNLNKIKEVAKIHQIEFVKILKDLFSGFYEEMIQHYNKIYYACDAGDIYTPLYASVELTEEIKKLFVECNCNYKLPDLVSEYDSSNLNKIKEAAKIHQIEFVKILENNDIHITEFNNINELKDYLKKI